MDMYAARSTDARSPIRRRLLRWGMALGVASLLSGHALADLGGQRRLFQDAERALAQGDTARYRQAKEQLGDYPLLPYLDYQELKMRLASASRAEVDRFLEAHGDTPLAGPLRGAWLAQLADRGLWQEYLDYFEPTSGVDARCRYLYALIRTGHRDSAFAQVPPLWLSGRSQPEECDPVFDAWRQAGGLSDELVWGRARLAIERGEERLAAYLGRFLEASDRVWLERWLTVQRSPETILDAAAFASPHPQRAAILLDGVERLARTDPEGARAAWDTLAARFRFTAEEEWQARRALALARTRAGDPDALADLERLEPCGSDQHLHTTRILAAIEAGDWVRTLTWIEALPSDERDSERWRYWSARALEQLGHAGEARRLFAEVARDRTYYAFLAADRIGIPYKLDHRPLEVDPRLLKQVSALPAARRADELLRLGRTSDARREWGWLTRALDRDGLKAAARIALDWRWHDQAIFTLARTGYWDDLEMRFPLEHLDLVQAQAQRNGIQAPWVMAVVRQESVFAEDARSRAGAMGLMQLMPATAGDVAKRLGKAAPRRHDLLDPQTNIQFGTSYLGQMYQRLDHHPVLATAAYNAGPGRVERWLPDRTQEADIWVELIPFSETRGYVQRVMAYTVIYERRLGLEPALLAQRMRPIPGAPARTAASRPQPGGSSS